MQIKSLAAELCLDRAVVLELLREPPPNLLMMSLSLPDEPNTTVVESEPKPMEIVEEEIQLDHAEPRSKAKVPVHVMHHTWSAQKRLKRVHVDTLERIYRRTKRPTVSNVLYSSISAYHKLHDIIRVSVTIKMSIDALPNNLLHFFTSGSRAILSLCTFMFFGRILVNMRVYTFLVSCKKLKRVISCTFLSVGVCLKNHF